MQRPVASIQLDAGTETITADYYVAAVAVEVMASLSAAR
jgi:hypothetical protein